eukprot:gnl/MRDRNA2_/MRDRNA2_30834_c0_seq2.p1 gnl/MRDRNA2_/MRDRNA2_30834_c0~~gnl/MRDRNA2_/MRDRNA2_30834_c0_seq2.p1  ORF type:complete len:317 (+),score=51.98 gnl/MRDRNA2_/MRDRNA2_30834_c0_seq2:46-996(+)
MEERMMHGTMLINLIGLLAQVHTKDLLANQRSNTQLKMDWSEASSVDMVQDSVGNAHGSMDMLVNKMVWKLLGRTLKVTHIHQTNVEKTTLGKPGRVAVPLQSSPRCATSHLSASLERQTRPLPNLIARRAHSEEKKEKSSVHRLAPVLAAMSPAPAEPVMESANALAGADLEAVYASAPAIPKHGHIHQIHSEEEFDGILEKSSGVVVLEVDSRYCRACRYLARTVQRIAYDYYGKASFLKVTWDENESTRKLAVTRLQVKRTPSFFVFLNGELMAITKPQPRDALDDALRSTLDECVLPQGTSKEESPHAPSIA